MINRETETMSELIFGYTWDEIHGMQQKRRVGRVIDLKTPGKEPATVTDMKMLEEYGSIEELEAAGFYGIADRLKG